MRLAERAARIGAPYAAPRSMPSCMRPQRQPNGLVIGAETGQIMPDDDGAAALDVESLLDVPLLAALLAAAFAWAARICAASCALESFSASISSASARSFSDRSD